MRFVEFGAQIKVTLLGIYRHNIALKLCLYILSKIPIKCQTNQLIKSAAEIDNCMLIREKHSFWDPQNLCNEDIPFM